MKVLRLYYLLALLLTAFALSSLSVGCELVTEFDRSKLLDASQEADGSIVDFDTSTPPKEDGEIDAGVDADTGVADGGCTSSTECSANSCQVATCVDGGCVITEKEPGDSCVLDGVDAGEGACNAAGQCVGIGCNNGLLDNDETDVDCGGDGDCLACENGKICNIYSDCVSGFCQDVTDSEQDSDASAEASRQCAACVDDDDCADMEDGWCDTDDGICLATKDNGSDCQEDNECKSGICKADYDDDEDSWCSTADECVHDGEAYDDGDVSPDCYNSTSRAICDEGSWTSDGCGDELAQDSDSANDAYQTAGTVTVYSACVDGACGTTKYDDSCEDNVLTEYGVDGVSEVSNEFDCETLATKECSGNTETTHAWICDGDPARCVADTDTTRTCPASDCSSDDCASGCTFIVRECDGSNGCVETSQNPDDDESYCTGCSLTWLPNVTETGNNCCGDDQGEDIEQTTAAGRGCCYNAAVLASGSPSGSILCYNGGLYDCGGAETDDSDLATTSAQCDSVGTLFCRSDNTWASTNEGCSCTGNPDCSSNHCRTDWDGVGQFCAQDNESCVDDDSGTISQHPNGWVECDGGDSYRVCTNGVWDASATACDAATCNSGCGYVSDNDNACVSGQGLGAAGGCEFEDGVGTAPTCNDCGDLTANAGGCNTGVSDCSIACGSSLCDGDATVDSGVDYCSVDGDSYSRIDACSVNGTTCESGDDGTGNDSLNALCVEYACTAGACLASCSAPEDCAPGYTCNAPNCE